MKKPELYDFINHNSANWFSAAHLRHKKDYLVNLANDLYERWCRYYKHSKTTKNK